MLMKEGASISSILSVKENRYIRKHPMIFNKLISTRISTFSIALSLLTANAFVDAGTMRQYQLETSGKGYAATLPCAGVSGWNALFKAADAAGELT